MKITLTAAAAILLLAAPAFAQGMSGPSASVKTNGTATTAMSSGAGMSGNAMASGTVKKKKTKAAGGMSGSGMAGGSMSGPSGSMSGGASGSATTP
jgi:hypothetical protein